MRIRLRLYLLLILFLTGWHGWWFVRASWNAEELKT